MTNTLIGIGLTAALTFPLVLCMAGIGDSAEDGLPQAEITNGELRAKVYLPDACRGFYRGTRFDWSGIVSSLEYKGHNF
jgi:hypothetical protein